MLWANYHKFVNYYSVSWLLFQDVIIYTLDDESFNIPFPLKHHPTILCLIVEQIQLQHPARHHLIQHPLVRRTPSPIQAHPMQPQPTQHCQVRPIPGPHHLVQSTLSPNQRNQQPSPDNPKPRIPLLKGARTRARAGLTQQTPKPWIPLLKGARTRARARAGLTQQTHWVRLWMNLMRRNMVRRYPYVD